MRQFLSLRKDVPAKSASYFGDWGTGKMLSRRACLERSLERGFVTRRTELCVAAEISF
jgi:hypothetical protein